MLRPFTLVYGVISVRFLPQLLVRDRREGQSV